MRWICKECWATLVQRGDEYEHSKSTVVVFEREEEMTECAVQLHGQQLEKVRQFVHLGSVLDRNGRIDGEIDRCVNSGLRVVSVLGKFPRNADLSHSS